MLDTNILENIIYYWIWKILTLDWQAIERQESILEDICGKTRCFPFCCSTDEHTQNKYVNIGMLKLQLTWLDVMHGRQKVSHQQNLFINNDTGTSFGEWYMTSKRMKQILVFLPIEMNIPII